MTVTFYYGALGVVKNISNSSSDLSYIRQFLERLLTLSHAIHPHKLKNALAIIKLQRSHEKKEV